MQDVIGTLTDELGLQNEVDLSKGLTEILTQLESLRVDRFSHAIALIKKLQHLINLIENTIDDKMFQTDCNQCH